MWTVSAHKIMTLLPPAEPELWAMTELVPFSQNFSLGNIDRVIKSIKYRHISSWFILCPVKYNIGKNSSDHSAGFSSINGQFRADLFSLISLPREKTRR